MSTSTSSVHYRKCYDVQQDSQEQFLVRLSDRQVTFNKRAWENYQSLSQKILRKDMQLEVVDEKFLNKLRVSGLAYDVADIPDSIDATEFYEKYFDPALTAWLYKAFSHEFWDLMIQGDGSAQLYAGWLFELYHYTKNANRHMPLATAECSHKRIKTLLAKHYVEEWNHYDFFANALMALGYTKKEIENSKQLPMTAEMSNFMREAARRDSLAYAICSAVLEGSTVDRKSFNPFYEAVKKHYQVPEGAVKPIYDHLVLDKQYQHANLFREICEAAGTLDAKQVSVMLSYGYQMVDHIWMWTDNIWKYYRNPENPIPLRSFDIYKD